MKKRVRERGTRVRNYTEFNPGPVNQTLKQGNFINEVRKEEAVEVNRAENTPIYTNTVTIPNYGKKETVKIGISQDPMDFEGVDKNAQKEAAISKSSNTLKNFYYFFV
jgi:hypothetical protein